MRSSSVHHDRSWLQPTRREADRSIMQTEPLEFTFVSCASNLEHHKFYLSTCHFKQIHPKLKPITSSNYRHVWLQVSSMQPRWLGATTHTGAAAVMLMLFLTVSARCVQGTADGEGSPQTASCLQPNAAASDAPVILHS